MKKETFLKKKEILKKWNSLPKNTDIKTLIPKLTKQQKKAIQKAEYDVFLEKHKQEVDRLFAPLIEASSSNKVKIIYNWMDGDVDFELINKFKKHVMQICPEFYEIVKLLKKVSDKPLEEQESLVIEEYAKIIK